MINSEFNMLSTSINNVLIKIEELTITQLNEIPKGFSNNIIWNVGHLMVVQKLLIYGLSNHETNLDEVILDHYKKGSKPKYRVVEPEINYIKTELNAFVDKLKNDVNKKKFQNYSTYKTSYNFEITNFNDALVMVNLHCGLHFSTILKLLKEI